MKIRIKPDRQQPRRFAVDTDTGRGWREAICGFTATEIDDLIRDLKNIGGDVVEDCRERVA